MVGVSVSVGILGVGWVLGVSGCICLGCGVCSGVVGMVGIGWVGVVMGGVVKVGVVRVEFRYRVVNKWCMDVL